MSKRLESVADAVGNTPLVRLRRVVADSRAVRVYVKLECQNPGGSVKDRAALRMMRDALADGRLTKEKTLIDSTSGNTGVAYSLFGATLGVKVKLVMPSNVSQPRKEIARAFGRRSSFRIRSKARTARSDSRESSSRNRPMRISIRINIRTHRIRARITK